MLFIKIKHIRKLMLKNFPCVLTQCKLSYFFDMKRLCILRKFNLFVVTHMKNIYYISYNKGNKIFYPFIKKIEICFKLLLMELRD